ncbi:MAG: hypothetical protein EOM26_09020 [Alphaproteobacteria bacterium]|nr:hypothetical protein [Alphaproteobacteria bacterium]
MERVARRGELTARERKARQQLNAFLLRHGRHWPKGKSRWTTAHARELTGGTDDERVLGADRVSVGETHDDLGVANVFKLLEYLHHCTQKHWVRGAEPRAATRGGVRPAVLLMVDCTIARLHPEKAGPTSPSAGNVPQPANA